MPDESVCYVLIVDDDPEIRETLRFLLEDAGFQVEVAANGLEALDFLRDHPRCMVVLSDYLMPKMDGAALLKAVIAAGKDQCHKFIILSAKYSQMPADFVELVQQRNIPLIRKPFDVDDLIHTISRVAATVPPAP